MPNKPAEATVKKNSVPVRERTYEYLKERLLSGRLEPGERLTEENLAARIGVSRTPVREALHKLEQEGLVKPLETRGFIVTPSSREEIEELFAIRSILEGFALRCAVEKITETDFERLEDFIQKAEEALKQRNFEKIYRYNTKFHDTLHGMVSDMPRLHSMMADMRKYVLRHRKDTLHSEDSARRAIEGHRKIMLALRLKEPELCERIMRKHIQESMDDALEASFSEC
ncbi:MAG: GntR family transcriptional regulator [Desulfobacteraceae bacterium]|nr:MAG: GntR family transcriptional regulator [Desulfobacteraceae bacterium]